MLLKHLEDNQDKISKSGHWIEQCLLAKSQNLSLETQKTLSESTNDNVRNALWNNKSVSSEFKNASVELFNTALMATDSHWGVRCEAAMSKHVNRKIQEKLVNDYDACVRSSIASNPLLDSDLQVKLAKDKDPNVRENLARNPSISLEAQKILAKDVGSLAKSNLRLNKNADKDVLDSFKDLELESGY